ncbi:MAG: peptidoglycan DD-metalloendopeptidase family protein [Ruminococcus sp.]|nr:peptidoglycan DD-metalloendopeptidase family protein [Ruminococcus sp.]
MKFIESLFIRAGIFAVKFLTVIIIAVCSMFSFIFRGIRRFIMWIFREFTESFRHRVSVSNRLVAEIRRTKKSGGKPYITAVMNFIGSFFFGEDGVIYTAFNYILPIVSAAFLIGVVRYSSGLQYGLAVEYNGKELGIIMAEADFEEAERDVRQRISHDNNDEIIDLSAKFALKAISSDDKLISSGQLADKILEASDEELTEAYGIYIDGSFIGAVKNKKAVQDALDKNLLDYKPDGIVKEVKYASKIEYIKGIYLADSVRSEKDTIALLTSSTENIHPYVVQKDDTELSIVQKFGMKLDDFFRMNPKAENKLKAGQIVSVAESERYLPVQYVRELETITFLDYETVEVETSSLSIGIRAVLVKGERGEKKSSVEITYVDGIEKSRKVLKSYITKKPVVETIGIGTYSAIPDDPQTVYFGSPLVGTGEMGWPVDGGWVSDSFISDRNHKGMDIAASEGTEIYAAKEGWVVASGWNSGGYGNMVMIEHEDGYSTLYAHMIMVYAAEGQYVTKGQLIGFVGNTGNSFGDHCHFEVRSQGICVDPSGFLNTQNIYKEDEDTENKDMEIYSESEYPEYNEMQW